MPSRATSAMHPQRVARITQRILAADMKYSGFGRRNGNDYVRVR